ncbi:hypothetical protein SUGI_1031120 [Cryptomeria japonica]|uniref:uncharacterized protein LOC131076129 n=1 Tax=Cryptomeria japonica TaxID=3369 RepID=UPI00241492F1|nr:uncharacterized protein LOC131076129 [Cryptomeria japonica]GLJ48887.1 hypothetical protein SUGI_1031120 [Cryptomeria japonica]
MTVLSNNVFDSLMTREVRPFTVRNRPNLATMTSEGGVGNGVLTIECDYGSTPALAVSFAKTRSCGHILAVSDEEGFVSLFNTRRRLPSFMSCEQETVNARTERWRAHYNALFDLCWIRDDAWMLTASGDQAIKLWDVEARAGLGIMKFHTGSVKSLCSHPLQSELFASGSRDGTIAFWDMRSASSSCDQTNEECFLPVASIIDAHIANHGRRVQRNKASKSITAVLYLKDERVIASAGAADSVVKFWDTRKLKAPIAQTPHQCQEGRVHGVSSLAQDSTGTFIIASCMDNKIYMYNTLQPDKSPLKSFSGHELDSFYIKSCFSPDGTHILSGSSDGNAFIWQVDRPEESPVKLNGHLRETTAVDWCPSDFCKIATCSDDYTVRVWNIENSNFERMHSTPSAIRQRISAYPASISQRLFSSPHNGHLENPLPDTPAYDLEFVSADKDKAITSHCLRENEASTPKASKISVSKSLSTESLSLSPNSDVLSRVFSPSGKEGGATTERTPESMKSPSSVLNPPSSSKRKTILDYFGAN